MTKKEMEERIKELEIKVKALEVELSERDIQGSYQPQYIWPTWPEWPPAQQPSYQPFQPPITYVPTIKYDWPLLDYQYNTWVV